MIDPLYEAAVAYDELTHYEYDFRCGRKGQLLEITIRFPADGFHHLVGLQYVSKLSSLNRKSALSMVLNKTITSKSIGAGFKHWDRPLIVCALKTIIETNKLVFRYRKHEQAYSAIRAEYLISYNNNLVFIDDGIPVSCFYNFKNVDYDKNCPRYTVLQIDKRNIDSGACVTVYSR